MSGLIWRASIMELLGSFALTLATIKYVSNSLMTQKKEGDTGGVKIALGQPILEIEAAKMIFCLSFFTWAGFAVSGAHYNPVVTISMFMARKTDPISTVFYLIFQAIGSFAAGALQFFLTKITQNAYVKPAGDKMSSWHYMLPFLSEETGWIRGCLLEGFATFIFIIVYQSMMLDKRSPKGMNCFAVGCAYGLCSLTIGIATGGCINPFIYLLPRLMTFEIGQVLVYTIGPLVGAVGGAVYYRVFMQQQQQANLKGESTPFRNIVMTNG